MALVANFQTFHLRKIIEFDQFLIKVSEQIL